MATPSEPPLQAIVLLTLVFTDTAAGFDNPEDTVTIQPLASVTVIVYVPAANPTKVPLL